MLFLFFSSHVCTFMESCSHRMFVSFQFVTHMKASSSDLTRRSASACILTFTLCAIASPLKFALCLVSTHLIFDLSYLFRCKKLYSLSGLPGFGLIVFFYGLNHILCNFMTNKTELSPLCILLSFLKGQFMPKFFIIYFCPFFTYVLNKLRVFSRIMPTKRGYLHAT